MRQVQECLTVLLREFPLFGKSTSRTGTLRQTAFLLAESTQQSVSTRPKPETFFSHEWTRINTNSGQRLAFSHAPKTQGCLTVLLSEFPLFGKSTSGTGTLRQTAFLLAESTHQSVSTRPKPKPFLATNGRESTRIRSGDLLSPMRQAQKCLTVLLREFPCLEKAPPELGH
jgi:hypothetical protein